MPSDHPPARPAPSIFLSYASADRQVARTLRDTLAAAGLDVWLDEEELAGGEAWDAKIRQQIRTCTYFMPVISATTEGRREGYFRREWRWAVERTLDQADDVLFLVPVVIDDTRDYGARVPERFLSVQWLRCPGGAATPELQELAARLASGETQTHITAAIPAPTAPETKSNERTRRERATPPPLPRFPAYPQANEHSRFLYDVLLWAGHLIHALWLRLPRPLQLFAAVLIIIKLVGWIFSDSSAPDAPPTRSEPSATTTPSIPADPAKVDQAEAVIKNLVGAAVHTFQVGRPLAVIRFGGNEAAAQRYATAVFDEAYNPLKASAPNEVALSPLPLEPEDDADDALARGTQLRSRYLLTGRALRPTPESAVVLSVHLYAVESRAVVWTDQFAADQVEAAAAAAQIVAAVRRNLAPPTAPASPP